MVGGGKAGEPKRSDVVTCVSSRNMTVLVVGPVVVYVAVDGLLYHVLLERLWARETERETRERETVRKLKRCWVGREARGVTHLPMAASSLDWKPHTSSRTVIQSSRSSLLMPKGRSMSWYVPFCR